MKLSKETLALLSECGDEKDMEDARWFLLFDRSDNAFSVGGGIIMTLDDIHEDEINSNKQEK